MALYINTTKVGSTAYMGTTKLNKIKFNGTDVWSGRPSLPTRKSIRYYCVHNNELYALNTSNNFFKWNGQEWVNLTSPFSSAQSNQILVEAFGDLVAIYQNKYYVWNDNSATWTEHSISYNIYTAFFYENKLYISYKRSNDSKYSFGYWTSYENLTTIRSTTGDSYYTFMGVFSNNGAEDLLYKDNTINYVYSANNRISTTFRTAQNGLIYKNENYAIVNGMSKKTLNTALQSSSFSSVNPPSSISMNGFVLYNGELLTIPSSSNYYFASYDGNSWQVAEQ